MKHSNVIDLTNYFLHEKKTAEEQRDTELAAKIVRIMCKLFDMTATAAITLCVCACTLLFFTML